MMPRDAMFHEDSSPQGTTDTWLPFHKASEWAGPRRHGDSEWISCAWAPAGGMGVSLRRVPCPGSGDGRVALECTKSH